MLPAGAASPPGGAFHSACRLGVLWFPPIRTIHSKFEWATGLHSVARCRKRGQSAVIAASLRLVGVPSVTGLAVCRFYTAAHSYSNLQKSIFKRQHLQRIRRFASVATGPAIVSLQHRIAAGNSVQPIAIAKASPAATTHSPGRPHLLMITPRHHCQPMHTAIALPHETAGPAV